MKLVILMLLISACITSSFTLQLVREDYNRYISEGTCVAEYISSGIERKDIITSHGTCWVIKD